MSTVSKDPPVTLPSFVSFLLSSVFDSTPSRIRGALGLIFVLSALLFATGEGTLSRARVALRAIGNDSAPSIIAAQEINASLADLDANAANILMGTRAQQQAASNTFETQRVRLTQRLVDVAQGITYGDAEKAPIVAIFEGFGRYLELVAEARFRMTHGDPKGAVDSYLVASSLMHQKIIPAGNELDATNALSMRIAYETQRSADMHAEEGVGIFGAALGLALVGLQYFLARRTRRIFSLPLVAATVLTLIFTLLLVSDFGAVREDLRIAKDDAFQSIHLFWQARAIAFDANGDKSRFLLDRTHAAEHEAAFTKKVALLTTHPELTPPHGGLFATGYANVTLQGEGDAIYEVCDAFARYYRIDDRMRKLVLGGHLDEAIELGIGTQADESNAALANVERALERLIAINRAEFDRVLERGDRGLKQAELLDPAFAIAIALLAFLGARPRLREYAG